MKISTLLITHLWDENIDTKTVLFKNEPSQEEIKTHTLNFIESCLQEEQLSKNTLEMFNETFLSKKYLKVSDSYFEYEVTLIPLL